MGNIELPACYTRTASWAQEVLPTMGMKWRSAVNSCGKMGSSETPERAPGAILRALIQKSACRDMVGVGELASMPRILASVLRLSHE